MRFQGGYLLEQKYGYAHLFSYASRAVSKAAKGPGARERAIKICSLQGQIDREKDLKLTAAKKEEENVDDEYDPWAGLNDLNRQSQTSFINILQST